MIKSLPRFSLCLLPLVFGLVGCETFDKGATQEVAVKTFPAGATVMLDGEDIGRTPTEIELSRKIPHRVILKKEGYKTIDATIAPVKNEAGQGYVRFGLMDDAGLYYDLDPNPVEINLVPAVLPPSRGPDAYEEMATIIAEVDQKREAGQIGPVEHKYMVDQVIEFYSN
ncbi:PEGA domain-containing protein [Rubellicoccus peritrichatus]|uniref:PEGA domain-containing protein n=1 Tax=Rubellicoccus peritrichatus TaxID=3080537 RepID=A0AAQ3L9A6_9BACT|nr:PEGA domain-containing protein [Puniceicoccus sp. CR14]WOO41735.1 PEGA domain-containing protein [Puniceicoccus sp. CR14]